MFHQHPRLFLLMPAKGRKWWIHDQKIMRGVRAMFAQAFSMTTHTHIHTEVNVYVKCTSYTFSNLFQIQNFDFSFFHKAGH